LRCPIDRNGVTYKGNLTNTGRRAQHEIATGRREDVPLADLRGSRDVDIAVSREKILCDRINCRPHCLTRILTNEHRCLKKNVTISGLTREATMDTQLTHAARVELARS
jgi:hypothetical protein